MAILIELVSLRREHEKLLRERECLLQRAEGFMIDYEQEKKEKFELKVSTPKKTLVIITNIH